jgi:hypothetical protein
MASRSHKAANATASPGVSDAAGSGTPDDASAVNVPVATPRAIEKRRRGEPGSRAQPRSDPPASASPTTARPIRGPTVLSRRRAANVAHLCAYSPGLSRKRDTRSKSWISSLTTTWRRCPVVRRGSPYRVVAIDWRPFSQSCGVARPAARTPQSSRWTRSIRSWRSCASIDSVAIGRASSRLRPIGSPVSSQKP